MTTLDEDLRQGEVSEMWVIAKKQVVNTASNLTKKRKRVTGWETNKVGEYQVGNDYGAGSLESAYA